MAPFPPTTGDRPGRLAGALFAFIGLGLLTGAVLTGLSTHRFLQTAARAPGIVSRLNAGGSHPEIRFTAADGQIITYPQGGMIFGYEPGDPVTVLYDPKQPTSTATISAPGALWDSTGGLTFLGTVFFAIGLARALGSKAVYVRGLDE